MSRIVIISEIPVSYRTGWFQHLADSGLDIHVVYLAEGQSDRPWEESADLPRWASLAPSLALGGTARGHFPRVTPSLGRTLLRLRPDLVILPGWAHPACWQAASWSKRNHIPFAIAAETWQPQNETRIPSRITSAVRDRMLGSAAAVLPVGAFAEEYFHRLAVEHVYPVRSNTCDSDAIARSTAGLERTSPPEALFVGRLMEHKGAGILIELSDQLAESGIALRIIGAGPMAAEIERVAVRNPLVNFDGAQPAAATLTAMARASVVVVPSLKEPWGVVVHEALACGTPVVASPMVGSAADLVTDGVGMIREPIASEFALACRTVIERGDNSTACRAAAHQISYTTAMVELEHAVAAMLFGADH